MGVRPDVYVGGGALNSMCKAPHGRYVPVDERYVASNSFRNEKRNEGERVFRALALQGTVELVQNVSWPFSSEF